MATFPLHTLMSAPGGSKPFLALARRMFGEVPNLAATLAESPSAIEAYFTLNGLFAQGELTSAERFIVLLTASVEQECHYCVAAHKREAEQSGLEGAVIAALLDRAPLADERSEALRQFVVAAVRQRAQDCGAEADRLLALGYSRAALLDVVLGVSLAVLGNYVNHIAETPLDDFIRGAQTPDAAR
ncbi:MAG: carboxymuconolactone decarboxylase family protein [Hyphomonadaceae bacterium]